MDFGELLEAVGDEPVFETGLLLAGDVDPLDVRRQLSRWTGAGRLYQLRRGLYAVAPPFQKVRPHPFLVANRLVLGSYVSLQSGLAHYGLIPEAVPVTTSVTSDRPRKGRLRSDLVPERSGLASSEPDPAQQRSRADRLEPWKLDRGRLARSGERSSTGIGLDEDHL